jgi:signal transduction histidine kinase
MRDDTGRLRGIIGAVRDIDQEKRNREELVAARMAAETADAAKSAFLATVSHENRTPSPSRSRWSGRWGRRTLS